MSIYRTLWVHVEYIHAHSITRLVIKNYIYARPVQRMGIFIIHFTRASVFAAYLNLIIIVLITLCIKGEYVVDEEIRRT